MKRQRDNIRVLVAEDNYLVSEMIKGSLEEMGYTIAGEAIDGLEALKLTKELRPDVVLMDIEMPGKNGIEATELIFDHCPTPVVVLTAYETPELVAQASSAGVGAYIIKPPNPREIERAITIAIARFEDTLALRNLNATLKARNEELDTFAHTVSNNLQYSLDMVIGYSNMLKTQARLPEELEHYINMITKTSHTMTDVIDELQLLAGVRTTEITATTMNMGRIVAQAQQRLAYTIEKTQTKIIFPTSWPTACGYAPWIEEVWVNYLIHGIKHGGAQPPRLQLGATVRSNGTVRFWVRDNGPGLSEEQQKALFSLSSHVPQRRSQNIGLALSVAKRIVEKLKGEVGVESEGADEQGCTLFFTLPACSSGQTSVGG